MAEPVPGWDRELAAAVAASREAARIATAMQAGIAAEAKADGSPVTAADKECERVIAALLTEAFPDDGLFGEEGARRDSRSGRRWIVDPIDGTRDYVRGNQFWANLIALEAGDEVVCGLVHLPRLSLLYTATRGGGAYRNGERIQPSQRTDPSDSVFCMDGLNRSPRMPFRDRLLDCMSRFWAVRSFGGALDAMFVASGQAEVWIEASAQPWDFAPLKIIAEEAGARFFNFDGGSSIYAGNGVVCAPGLVSSVTELLNG